MKSHSRQFLSCIALALALVTAGTLRAQDTAKPDDKSAALAPSAAAATATPSTTAPAITPAPEAPSAPVAPTADSASAETATPKDAAAEPTKEVGSAAATTSSSTDSSAAATEPASAPEAGKAQDLRRLDQSAPSSSEAQKKPATEKSHSRVRGHQYQGNGNARVTIGGDSQLAQGESADAVVSVLGSSTSAGEVGDAVVSILGDTRVTGPVRDSAVAVLGDTYVNSRIGGAAVAVMGDVVLGPDADVRDVVSVGGTVTRDPHSIVRGQTQSIAIGGLNLARLGHLQGLRAWFTHCLLLGRPLGFGENLGWAWGVAAGFLALYVVIALLFGSGVDRCVQTLTTRPGFSVLAALLTVLLVPIATILLCVTVVGIAVVPFVAIGMIVATLFGKAVLFAAIGRPFTRWLDNGGWARTAVSVLIGGLIVMLLYTIPFFGFILMKVLGWLGAGVVVYTLILVSRRPKPAVATAVPTGRTTVPPPPADVPGMAPGIVPPMAGMAAGAAVATEAAVAAVPSVVAPAALPRAGFWIRLAAVLLDVVLCAILIKILNGILPHRAWIGMPGGFMVVLAVYSALMWKLRGTTIGGIVCGLRLIRLDGREIDWPTVVVRVLGGFLSFFVIGLGFLWAAFDDEKQSWHDKIAGTTIVYARGGVTLV
ncbi:MAG TPA: RDD family protein [Opitutaceae bacterium]|nr:RDD family protein [Opitutaceae bacterium]